MRESGDKAKKTKNFIIGGRVVIQNSKFKIQNSKFNAAVKARAEGACTLCQAEAVKHHPCGGVKFKIPCLRHCEENFSSMW